MKIFCSAAVITGAQAIHPGFGFLSENAKFAKMCAECNITFIGPSSEVISQMGDKAEARKQMIAANVPVIPGSDDVVATVEEGIELAKRIGFPLLIKAVAGGGGKGIRRVETVEEFEHQFVTARQEALQAFGNADVYMERIIYPAKHIEIQILADQHGNVVHLGERDCSLQRKNQRLSKKRQVHLFLLNSEEKWGKQLFVLLKQSAIKTQERLSFLWMKKNISISWK